MSKEIVSFQEILMVKGVAEFSKASDTLKRQRAVVSALELIKTDVSSSYSHNGTGCQSSHALEQHMNNLSEYTECILNAMNCSGKNSR
ncbi:MAG: hypothetical protein V7735_22455 [Photobacterium frigidiphilum]|uniref:Uncharacterized protein n=1 Tax=Photobacterium frigidiphilum TaxID=264736 RepID=A0A2T3JDB3_9GAMM|nr:hypothetical protein [Photobacterium frigidiphilum]PSU46864.1 hypothetical protein C9J12_16780 [Photobacterium frigidiphilum]